jgi:hypothetical protein
MSGTDSGPEVPRHPGGSLERRSEEGIPTWEPKKQVVFAPRELSRTDEIRLWAAEQGIQLGSRRRIPVPIIERYEAATGTPRIARLTTSVSHIEEYLIDQLAESGIWMTEGGPELDVVEGVDFGFEMRRTPSTRQLIGALTEVDKVIRMAAGFAGYTHPDLGVLSGGRLEDLTSLEVLLKQDSAAWDLQIEYLGLGSLHIKLKPSGKNIKKVVKDGAAVAAVLANLATFTGFTVKAVAPSAQSKPRVSHSVVYANNKRIPLPPPRKRDVIVQLPAGSTITETTRLSHGKRIEWKFKVGAGGAVVSGDWSR